MATCIASQVAQRHSTDTTGDTRRIVGFEYVRANDPVAAIRRFYAALSAEARALNWCGVSAGNSPELISRFVCPGGHASYLDSLAARDPRTWRAWFVTAADDSSRIVACGECCLNEEDKSRASFGSLVRREYQRRGIGRELGVRLVQDARDLGASFLELSYQHSNVPARMLVAELASVHGLRRTPADVFQGEVFCTYAL